MLDMGVKAQFLVEYNPEVFSFRRRLTGAIIEGRRPKERWTTSKIGCKKGLKRALGRSGSENVCLHITGCAKGTATGEAVGEIRSGEIGNSKPKDRGRGVRGVMGCKIGECDIGISRIRKCGNARAFINIELFPSDSN